MLQHIIVLGFRFRAQSLVFGWLAELVSVGLSYHRFPGATRKSGPTKGTTVVITFLLDIASTRGLANTRVHVACSSPCLVGL